MGRAIKPAEVRRLEDNGDIEVLSASGFWTKYGLLGDASKDALLTALAERGLVVPISDTFHFVFGDHDKGDPPPPPQGGGKLDQRDGDGQGQQDGQPDGGQDGQPQDGQGSGGGGQPPTVEDIIRRIAGEMDEAERQEMIKATLQTFVTKDELAQFQPKLGGDGDLNLLISKIEVHTPDVKLEKDGIFHASFPMLTKLVAGGQHTYLPGPPGTGKSHAAEQVASVLGWRFASISLGPTTPESRLWGGMDAHGKFFEPPFVTLARYAADNPESGSVFCLDELDNGHPGIIATLNSAMANGWFTAPNGDVITMGKNMVLIGCANTFGTGPTAEFAGRNKLDAATLDRFVYLPWDTDLGVEKALVHQYLDTAAAKAWLEVWRTCRKNAKTNGLKVFVTMRGCVNGARLIAGGIAPQEALDMTLLNKLPEDQRRKVQP